MSSLLLILLSTVLVNIVVLTSVSAWHPFAAVAGLFEGASTIAVACLVTVPLVAAAAWLLSHGLLEPLGLGYLRTLAFMAIVLTIVPLTEVALRRYSGVVPARPGFALLMTTNSTVLGVTLLVDSRMHNLIDALLFAIAAAGALGFLLLAFAAMHERLRHAEAPAVFREAPLALVTAGIMALAFIGFTGLVQE